MKLVLVHTGKRQGKAARILPLVHNMWGQLLQHGMLQARPLLIAALLHLLLLCCPAAA
jgi:hypothetical protein